MFLTYLKQIFNEYLIKFSENQSAPKLENRKTSPCFPCAPNLLHMLVSRIPGYHNLCSPVAIQFVILKYVPDRVHIFNIPKNITIINHQQAVHFKTGGRCVRLRSHPQVWSSSRGLVVLHCNTICPNVDNSKFNFHFLIKPRPILLSLLMLTRSVLNCPSPLHYHCYSFKTLFR